MNSFEGIPGSARRYGENEPAYRAAALRVHLERDHQFTLLHFCNNVEESAPSEIARHDEAADATRGVGETQPASERIRSGFRHSTGHRLNQVLAQFETVKAREQRRQWSAERSTLFESAGGLVGAGRFERPTPCAQGRCATRLRYAPTGYSLDFRLLCADLQSDTVFRLASKRRRKPCINVPAHSVNGFEPRVQEYKWQQHVPTLIRSASQKRRRMSVRIVKKQATVGCTCASALPAVTSAAVIHPKTNTRPGTSTQRSTLWYAPSSQAKTGCGVMSTRYSRSKARLVASTRPRA